MKINSIGFNRRIRRILNQTTAAQTDTTNAAILLGGVVHLALIISANFATGGTALFTFEGKIDGTWVTLTSFTLNETTQAANPIKVVQFTEISGPCTEFRYSIDKSTANSTVTIDEVSEMKGNLPFTSITEVIVNATPDSESFVGLL